MSQRTVSWEVTSQKIEWSQISSILLKQRMQAHARSSHKMMEHCIAGIIINFYRIKYGSYNLEEWKYLSVFSLAVHSTCRPLCPLIPFNQSGKPCVSESKPCDWVRDTVIQEWRPVHYFCLFLFSAEGKAKPLHMLGKGYASSAQGEECRRVRVVNIIVSIYFWG